MTRYEVHVLLDGRWHILPRPAGVDPASLPAAENQAQEALWGHDAARVVAVRSNAA